MTLSNLCDRNYDTDTFKQTIRHEYEWHDIALFTIAYLMGMAYGQ